MKICAEAFSRFHSVFLAVFCLLMGVFPVAQAAESRKTILCSIAPQALILKEIVGDHLAVEILLPAGASPETYQPSPRQLVRVSRSLCFFSIGVPMEQRLLPRLRQMAPDMKILAFAAPVIRRMDGQPDPHVWLSLENIGAFARMAAEELGRLFPERKELFQARGEEIRQKGLLCRQAWRNRVQQAGISGTEVFVHHPAYGYLLDELGLVQIAVEEEGKEPGARHLARLRERVSGGKCNCLLIPPQHFRDGKRAAEFLRLRPVCADPLQADDADWKAQWEKLAELVLDSFAEGSR